jgi:SWI/SNF-related matrix-associated actin-dependent regulator 1 of chromatin subfamily A
MLRRKKEDVLRDLPPKRRLVVPMEINNRKEYNKADVDLIRWLRDNFGTGKANKAAQAEALVRFSYLKQLAAEGMMEMAVQWIKDSLDANGKLVIFAIHYATIDKLQEELRNYNPVVLDGRKSKEEKQAAVDRFQNDPECRLFIGNIKAAGVGITLTASSNTVFVELGWTPGEHDQAEDRVHRIGQDAESVNAWYLIASNTIMEEVSEILDEKRRVMDAVLDGKDTPEDSMLKELLKKRLEG